MDTPAKKKKSTKKIILITVSIIGIGAVIYIATLYNTKNKGEMSAGTLSGRSKEFLRKQQQTPESDLFAAQLNATPDTSSTARMAADDCFSMRVGLKVSGVQHPQKCSITIFTEEPRTTITAFLREGTLANLDEDSGVKMRRLNTDLYTEKIQTFKAGEFIIFRAKDESKYESTAFKLVGGSLFAISMSSNTNENLDKRLASIIESVEFK